MTDDPRHDNGAIVCRPTADACAAPEYEPPRLTTLGTVGELTRGGNVSSNHDAFGTAGGSGVIP